MTNQPARDEVELLPCPLAHPVKLGVIAKSSGWITETANIGGGYARCLDCGLQIDARNYRDNNNNLVKVGRAEAVKLWNTRATPPIPVEDDRLKEIRERTAKAWEGYDGGRGESPYCLGDHLDDIDYLLTCLSQAEAEKNVLVDLLQRFLDSGVEVDDPRMGYAVMQIDHRDLQMARVAVKSFETAATEGKDK